ncbi:MAG: putative maltokinase, partial [Chloroflexi bacterium]|nr:putative maltokinase [Chloroflexota bacterium]
RFWLDRGLDGFRCDAVPYLIEREGTSCENLAETHDILKTFRRVIDDEYGGGRVLLAEANQWPEDVRPYFGDGDEFHMAFHFPLMPRMFMAIRMEDRFPIVEILQQTPPLPETAQWALFLRNHDELTLEMVTDADRDYMYRVYAQDPRARINLGIRRRLAPLLGNHRRRIELMKGLLFSMPGTPVIYYGDEIGMGDNIYLGDRNGVRTPMQWSSDRNAGFSRATPQKLYLPIMTEPEYHYEAVNVEAQQNNPHSLLWWMKRLIALRKRFQAFSRGSIEFLYPDNRKILAFVRRYRDERILVVANLSRFVQYTELDLSAFKGTVPVEIFGQTRFPPIGDQPYFLTLGPHAFYWIALEPQRREAPVTATEPQRGQAPVAVAAPELQVPVLTMANGGEGVVQGRTKAALEHLLPGYLRAQRWFGGKARAIRACEIQEAIAVPLAPAGLQAYLTLLKVEYLEGEPETYMLPLALATGEPAQRALSEFPHAVLARLRVHGKEETGVLYDALRERGFCTALLDAITRRRRFKGTLGELHAVRTRAFRPIWEGAGSHLEPALLRAEQSNTSVVYGDRFILKCFRRVEAGVNPDLEIGRFLTEARSFAHVPPVAGFLEYRRDGGEPVTLGILQGFVPNEGDTWQYTLDALGRYFERVLAHPVAGSEGMALAHGPLLDLAQRDLPPIAYELVGTHIQAAELLGQRTAELHLALASEEEDPDFVPEPFTPVWQQSLYQDLRSQAIQVVQLLRARLPDLPETTRAEAQRILSHEGAVFQRLRSILKRPIAAARIRCHGDYHLGQVLYTGKDFVIIDFEGEPARSLSERRLKRSPLRDVAGMLRSFHYAPHAALLGQATGVVFRPEDEAVLEPWARCWHRWISAAFLKAYLKTAAGAPFLPKEPADLQVLLETYLLEKAMYEVRYELNSRPDWVRIPLQGILELVEATE